MKVFISHAFGRDDEALADVLKEDLDAAGLEAYLAEKTPQYNLPISVKIRREIEKSDWLVAVITKRSHASASVHEEIGYALGKGVEVAPMAEEGVGESGVLVYGRETKRFRAPAFSKASREMARFIANSPHPPPRRRPLGEGAKALLQDRRILTVDSADFAQGARFHSLYSGSLGDDEKPVVLFTACPHDLGDRCDVTTPEFMEWAKSTGRVEVDGRQARVPGIEQSVDIKTLRVTYRHFGSADKNVALYREFQAAGLFEWGTSSIFFSRNDRGKVELQLCHMIGEFWAFLASARLFYEKIGLDAPFSVLLSIRNSYTLDLRNAGDEAHYVARDAERRFSPAPPAHTTDRPHIQLQYHFDTVRDMTDERIAAVAKKAARDICNAYGQAVPLCYNTDGSFSWRLYKDIATGAAGGGML